MAKSYSVPGDGNQKCATAFSVGLVRLSPRPSLRRIRPTEVAFSSIRIFIVSIHNLCYVGKGTYSDPFFFRLRVYTSMNYLIITNTDADMTECFPRPKDKSTMRNIFVCLYRPLFI